jgi:hypothetical protein
MELRNHLQMIWQGRPNWPPKWTGPHNSENPLPEGEVGVLTRVETTDPSLIAPHCILVIRYEDEDYLGTLFLMMRSSYRRSVAFLITILAYQYPK